LDAGFLPQRPGFKLTITDPRPVYLETLISDPTPGWLQNKEVTYLFFKDVKQNKIIGEF
jgi:hypothetical protein